MLCYAATIQQRIFRYDIHDVSMTTALSTYAHNLQLNTIIISTKTECTAADIKLISLFDAHRTHIILFVRSLRGIC